MTQPTYLNLMEAIDAHIFALVVPADAPEVSMTSAYVTFVDGKATASAYGRDGQDEIVWEYSRTFEPDEPGGDDAVMNMLYALSAVEPGEEHLPGFKNKRSPR